MKLVQLLAKELKEWPEGAKHARQDFDGEICFVGGDIWSDFYASCVASDIYLEDGIGTSQITEDQWQAEREKMNKPKWIRHRGGNQPVEDSVKVEYRMRDGDISTQPEYAATLRWSHWSREGDIMAYRVIEETKDQEIEEVKDTNIGTLSITLDANDVFKPMIASMKDMALEWGQIESPLKWRDAIIHCQAIIEDCEREIERNVNLLDAEGLMMQKDSKKAMQHYQTDIDMSDWRNWKAGDIVECLIAPDKHEGYYFSGINYKINEVDLDDEGTGREISVYCDMAMSLWCPSSSFKFIRRP